MISPLGRGHRDEPSASSASGGRTASTLGLALAAAAEGPAVEGPAAAKEATVEGLAAGGVGP